MTESIAADVTQAPPTKGSVLAEFRRGFPLVITSALGSALGVTGLAVYPLTYFMPAFQKAFGWDRASVGFAATFVTAAVFLVAPWSGRLCDKYGTRRVIPISTALFALGFVGLTFVGGSVWTLYIGVMVLAALGLGTIYVCYSRAINTWFDKGRGLALGIMTAGSGVTAFFLPLVLPPVIDRYGWKVGFLLLAGLAILVLPLTLLFVRDQPAGQAETVTESTRFGMAFGKVLRSYRFWCIGIGGFLVNTAVSGATLHLVPMFTDLGGEKRAMEHAASFYGLSLLVSRLITGWLLDRFPGRIVAAVMFAIPCVMVLTPGLFGPAVAPFYAIAIGIALSAETDIVAYLASRYFGLKAYAQSYGWLYACGALGFAAGPLLVGWCYRGFHDYMVVRLIWAALFAAGVVLFGVLGRYPTENELRDESA